MLVPVETYELERGLVCFRAGVAEKNFPHARDRAKAVRKLFLLTHAVDVGGVDQLAA